MSKILLFIIVLSIMSTEKAFDWQGHRGCRGLLPENSLPAFEKALEVGVTTLELDVVISSDLQVVVSHDPWMSPNFCNDPDGAPVTGPFDDLPNLYQMTYEEIRQYDCGSRGNPDYPDQQNMKTYKPLLADVFKQAEKYCKDHRRNEVYYNIEIKSRKEWDEVYQPDYWEFCDIVYATVDAYVPWSRVNIQSFDHRVLQYFHKMYPDVRLAVLEEFRNDPEEVLGELGFFPEVYSPHYRLLKSRKVKWLHDNDMKVVVWTVNDVKDMQAMIEMDVDGIITDYPNLIEEVEQRLD